VAVTTLRTHDPDEFGDVVLVAFDRTTLGLYQALLAD